jgi:glycosyltransferase involved in cell wall biosynthesis
MHLSVAMATYNGAAYVEAQLDSLAAQTCRPDELVVCDDGSTDATVALLGAFARRAPFPVRIHLNATRLGPTANFEQAIRQCRGDVIALCDQDDIWHPDKLSRLAAPFAIPRIGAVFSDAELIDAAGALAGRRLWAAVGFTPTKQRRAEHGRVFDVLLAHNVVTGATMAFRAAYRQQVLPIPPIWVHDAWIALVVAALADLSLIAEPLMRYRVHVHQAVGVGAPGLLAAFTGLWHNPQKYSATITNACVAVAEQLSVARDHLATLPGVRNRPRGRGMLTA